MTTHTLSSREFNQDVGRAKRASETGPVIITDRGHPAYVPLRHDNFRRLTQDGQNILRSLAQAGLEDVEFDPPPIGNGIFRPADLS